MSMRKVHVRDVVQLPAGMTGRHLTKEKYLVAPAHIARTGPQVYTARELGLHVGDNSMDPNRVLTLHRPAEEVFKPEVMRSFESKPLTDNHPPEDVTADNWKEYSVGDVRDVRQDGDMIAANVIVRDSDMVTAVQSGKAQLSCGYDFLLDLTPGEYDGVKCDGVQRAIDGNHVAIVDRGRAGPRVRIGDQRNKESDMSVRKIKVGDIEIGGFKIPGGVVVVADDADGRSVEEFLERHERSVRDALKAASDGAAQFAKDKAKHDEDAKRLAAFVADEEMCDADEDDDEDEDDSGKKKNPFAKDSFKTKLGKKLADAYVEIGKLKPLVRTDDQMQAAVAELAGVVADARTAIGDGFKPEGKSAAKIRREVLDHLVANDEDIKGLVEVIVGDDLAKAADADVLKAYRAALKASRATARSSTSIPTGDADGLGRAIAGFDAAPGGGGAVGKDVEVVGGRDAWMSRIHADSRKGGGAPKPKKIKELT